jgi:uncharacterized cupredoxin-like copper-binding protein
VSSDDVWRFGSGGFGPQGLAYHAASMRARSLALTLAATAVFGAACTNGGPSDTTTTSATPGTAPPTKTTDVTIVPGEWTYEYLGVKATFDWKEGSPATLHVKNGSDRPVGAPDVYIVTSDQRHVDGKAGGAATLDPGQSGDYTVTFPDGLTVDDLGLVVLTLGDVNWGALGPKVIEH